MPKPRTGLLATITVPPRTRRSCAAFRPFESRSISIRARSQGSGRPRSRSATLEVTGLSFMIRCADSKGPDHQVAAGGVRGVPEWQAERRTHEEDSRRGHPAHRGGPGAASVAPHAARDLPAHRSIDQDRADRHHRRGRRAVHLGLGREPLLPHLHVRLDLRLTPISRVGRLRTPRRLPRVRQLCLAPILLVTSRESLTPAPGGRLSALAHAERRHDGQVIGCDSREPAPMRAEPGALQIRVPVDAVEGEDRKVRGKRAADAGRGRGELTAQPSRDGPAMPLVEVADEHARAGTSVTASRVASRVSCSRRSLNRRPK